MHRTSLSIAILFFVSLGCAHLAFAAGGTCPSGANYLNPANPAGANVTLASLGVTNCYFVAAGAGTGSTGASDSNAGTSESSPWLHAPGMPNCASNCAAVTPSAGTGFIFRGGDTWHTGNSSPSSGVAVGGTWSWTWSGTSSAHIYIGVDQTWYVGSSWTRPIINGDNPLNSVSGSGAGVSSCTYGGGGANLFSANGAIYYHFDNFEMLGMCWGTGTTTVGAYIFTQGKSAQVQGSPNPNPRWIEDNYIHGWSHVKFNGSGNPSGSFGAAINGISGIPSNGAYYGVIMQFNVIDGSDSDSYSLSWCGNQGDTWIVQYNVVRYNGGDNSPLSTHIFHDNLFEWGYNADDGGSHTDWPLQNYGSEPGGGTFPGDGTPNLFYNNVVRHIPGSMSSVLWQFPQGSTPDYDFNNVFSDYEGSGNYNNFCQGSCGKMVVFNNTEENSSSGEGGCIYCNGDSGGGTITSVNNHWITSGTGTSAVFQSPSQVTETTPLYMTVGTASTDSYTVANDFAPTSSSGPTVTASGTNETTGYCADSVLHNAVAEAACVQGITGVSYNSTTHTVVYPANTPVARPSTGAWNVGAYQFSGSTTTTVAPPTSLTATVNSN
jgi:hypothetical protein